MSAVADRPDHKGGRKRQDMNDVANNSAGPARLILIQPEIDHVAYMIVASQRRHLGKAEGDRPQAPGSGYDPGASTDVMMEDAPIDDVAGETALLRPVPIFKLGCIHKVVRRRQADLGDCRNMEQRARPDEAVAPTKIGTGIDRYELDPRLR